MLTLHLLRQGDVTANARPRERRCQVPRKTRPRSHDVGAIPYRQDGGALRQDGCGQRTLSMSDWEKAGRIEGVVDFERCDECGLNGEEWSDAGAISAIERLPAQFANAVAGLGPDDLLHDQWIADGPSLSTQTTCGRSFLE